MAKTELCFEWRCDDGSMAAIRTNDLKFTLPDKWKWSEEYPFPSDWRIAVGPIETLAACLTKIADFKDMRMGWENHEKYSQYEQGSGLKIWGAKQSLMTPLLEADAPIVVVKDEA